MHESPESELIARSREGDQNAIAELFRRYYPSSLRLARAILRSEHDSEDAVQSSYVSAFEHFCDFRGESSFRTWISRIVVNRCIMQRRTPQHRASWVYLDEVPAGRGMESLTSEGPTPEISAYSREIDAAVACAVSHLPGDLREAFTLYCLSGLTVKEVADAQGVTRSAAKTRVFRARARVRSHLEPVWSHQRAA